MKFNNGRSHDSRELTFENRVMYSDESDFSEWIIIAGIDNIMNSNIYMAGKRIEINSVQDLSLYYAFGTAQLYTNQEGKRCIELSTVDCNTYQIETFGEYKSKFVEKYRQNWYEAIIANGFDKDFAWRWVYEQTYRE